VKDSKSKSYALRIEGHLVEPLQRLKKQHRRSLNSEINAALEAWIAVPGLIKAQKSRKKKAPLLETAVAAAPDESQEA